MPEFTKAHCHPPDPVFLTHPEMRDDEAPSSRPPGKLGDEMPERNNDFGKLGARGIKGHEAVARQLDALAGFVATPVTARRGLLARLRYLARSERARAAAREAGLTVTDRMLKAWLDGRWSPSRK